VRERNDIIREGTGEKEGRRYKEIAE